MIYSPFVLFLWIKKQKVSVEKLRLKYLRQIFSDFGGKNRRSKKSIYCILLYSRLSREIGSSSTDNCTISSICSLSTLSPWGHPECTYAQIHHLKPFLPLYERTSLSLIAGGRLHFFKHFTFLWHLSPYPIPLFVFSMYLSSPPPPPPLL